MAGKAFDRKVIQNNPDPQELAELHVATYDKLAGEYKKHAVVNLQTTQASIKKITKYCPPPAKALDVGCAVGNISEILRELGYEVDGIDISPKMIEVAKHTYPKVTFIQGDVMTNNFSCKYDLIVAFAFIHLFPVSELRSILARMKQLLSPKGAIYTGTTIATSFSQGFEIKKDYSGTYRRYRVRWTRQLLDALFESEGFEIIKVFKHEDGFDKTWMDYVLKVKGGQL